ncbi:hypothetical protein GCM10007301_15110 [Azorhizobium oxalatiphilum]|uniref:Uncharacterized protein n=2 Tax=Azorhizobium oxalatiphilum TaxID=980631 RepID=A0A917F6U0_9HYPH|nr:hypothetical protein GCM10007301_15110 [Azorhizobium oxalatiphilum]
MAKAATLEARRREMIAALAATPSQSTKRARLGDRLQSVTTEMLRAELRTSRPAKRRAPTSPRT